MGKGLQRAYRHLRPQVGAADADVDDVGDGRIRNAHCFSIARHGVQGLCVDLGCLAATNLVAPQSAFTGHYWISQQPMGNGPLLGRVDGLPSKQRIAVFREAALHGQFEQ